MSVVATSNGGSLLLRFPAEPDVLILVHRRDQIASGASASKLTEATPAPLPLAIGLVAEASACCVAAAAVSAAPSEVV